MRQVSPEILWQAQHIACQVLDEFHHWCRCLSASSCWATAAWGESCQLLWLHATLPWVASCHWLFWSFASIDFVGEVRCYPTSKLREQMKLSVSESDFFSSVKAGDVFSVKQALRPEPYLTNFQDEIGKSPLWLAVENCLPEMAETLIAHGASVNVTDQDGNSLLHLIVNNWLNSNRDTTRNFISIVNILLNSGININITNNKGLSCLHEAAISGDKEMALFLIENGADINQKNNEGFTPFLWGLCANVWERDIPRHVETLEVLVKFGADVNAVTDNSETALKLAEKWNSRSPFIQFLKEHGAS